MTVTADGYAAQLRTVKLLLKAINEDRRQSIPGVHTDDFVAEDMNWGLSLDSEEAKAFGDKWIAAMRDYHMELVEFFSSGPNGVFTWVVSATVGSPEDGTEKRWSMRGVSILEFSEDNLIRKETAYQDVNALRRQLGLEPIDMGDLGERLGDLALVNANHAGA